MIFAFFNAKMHFLHFCMQIHGIALLYHFENIRFFAFLMQKMRFLHFVGPGWGKTMLNFRITTTPSTSVFGGNNQTAEIILILPEKYMSKNWLLD